MSLDTKIKIMSSGRAQKVLETFLWEPKFSKRDEKSALIRALKEVINQLQKSPGVIMCSDLLELCEELEGQDKKEAAEPEYEYFHISYRKDAPF